MADTDTLSHFKTFISFRIENIRTFYDYLFCNMWLSAIVFAFLAGLAQFLPFEGITPVAWAQNGDGCVNIAGQWDVTESVTITCQLQGESDTLTQSGSGTVTMQQSGCNISYTVPQINVIRAGTIVGDTLHLTGPFVVFQPGVVATENNLTIVGTVENGRRIPLSGTGVASGSLEGIPFTCNGTSTALMTRDVPDLVVSAVVASNATPKTNQSFTISSTVRNQGQASASSTTLRYYRSTNSQITTSDTQIASDEVVSLSPNGTSLESSSVSIGTAGTYWLGACVDPVIGESPTTNNCSPGVQVDVTDCKSVAIAILRGGPHTIFEPNEPHNHALSDIKTLALATGDGRVAAEVFDAILTNPQINKVENWLGELNEGCSEPIPVIIVGHSLGGDAAIKVDYDNVCSRILFDPFDPSFPQLWQGRAPGRLPPGDGAVYSFLAPIPNVFQGRPLKSASNVHQECILGADHNSIIEAVLGTTSFQNNIVGLEVTRCIASSATPLLGVNDRCFQSINIIPMFDLLLNE